MPVVGTPQKKWKRETMVPFLRFRSPETFGRSFFLPVLVRLQAVASVVSFRGAAPCCGDPGPSLVLCESGRLPPVS